MTKEEEHKEDTKMLKIIEQNHKNNKITTRCKRKTSRENERKKDEVKKTMSLKS